MEIFRCRSSISSSEARRYSSMVDDTCTEQDGGLMFSLTTSRRYYLTFLSSWNIVLALNADGDILFEIRISRRCYAMFVLL